MLFRSHVINYRYKCGDLVTTKSFDVDHSGTGPEHRVPYVYPTPILTQVDNSHYKIDIHAFGDGSNQGVTDTNKIKVGDGKTNINELGYIGEQNIRIEDDMIIL